MEDIKKLVDQLDMLVPKENAKVLMTQYGGGPDESKLVANERGYLRLGIEVMKLSFAKKGVENDLVILETDYLIHPGSTVEFRWCERKDEILEASQQV